MSDGVVDAIAGPPCGGESFVTNVEVQVLGATLPRQVTARACAASQEGWLVCNRRAAGAGAAAAGAACWASCGYGGGKDEGRGVVAGETWDALLLQTERDGGRDGHTELRVSRTAAGVRQYSIAMRGPCSQAAGELTCP